MPTPNSVKAKDRERYLRDVARKHHIHLSPVDNNNWIYADSDTMKLQKYDERTPTHYAYTPHGSITDKFYNDKNEYVEPPSNSVVVFKRTFTECGDDECMAGILAHEATHSWSEWLINTKSKLSRTDQVPAEELIADKVALEISPSNSIIIGKGINQQHLDTCKSSTQTSCLDPVAIWHDYYSIDEIYIISNLVFGR